MSLVEKFHSERRQFMRSLKLVGIYSVLSNMCMLAMPIFMLNTYRSVIPSGNTSTLIGLFGFCMMLLACMGIFEAARQILLTRKAAQFEANLAGQVLVGELGRQHDPKLQTLSELGQLKSTLSSSAFTSVFDLPTAPLFIIIIFLIHPVLGITVMVGAIVLVGLTIWGDRDQDEFLERQQELNRESQSALQQQFMMQEYIRSQGLYREALSVWGQAQRSQLENTLKLTNRSALHAGIAKSSRVVFQIILIAVGALLVLAGDADIIVVFAASIIGGRALAPIDSLVGNWRTLRAGFTLYKGLEARFEDLNLPISTTPLPAPNGSIALNRVTYVPQPGSPPILRAINFRVEPGQSLAIIGPSGAGKSTIAKLLVGYLEPSVGVVRLDEQDLKAWDPIALGHYVGYVPQRIEFFEGTIQENIASMRRDDPKEWAVMAAQRAGVHDMIMGLPQGYDTMISRSGFWPSGGQSQLIALARAFYGDPRILVLDEPNAALDSFGEKILHEALQAARREKITTIVITQRPGLVQFVELLMMVRAGQVADFGPRDQVQAKQLASGGKAAAKKAQPAGQKAQSAAQKAQAADAKAQSPAKQAGQQAAGGQKAGPSKETEASPAKPSPANDPQAAE